MALSQALLSHSSTSSLKKLLRKNMCAVHSMTSGRSSVATFLSLFASPCLDSPLGRSIAWMTPSSRRSTQLSVSMKMIAIPTMRAARSMATNCSKMRTRTRTQRLLRTKGSKMQSSSESASVIASGDSITSSDLTALYAAAAVRRSSVRIGCRRMQSPSSPRRQTSSRSSRSFVCIPLRVKLNSSRPNVT